MRPGLLALDFDGVVCDGIDEMVESSWRTLAEVTKRELPTARRAELHARFSALRPAIEHARELAALPGVLSERRAAVRLRHRPGRAEAREVGRAPRTRLVAWIGHG